MAGEPLSTVFILLFDMPKAIVCPTRGAVSAAETNRTQSSNESHDQSMRRSAGSG